jgi:uncharacterized membrane protein YedE/YeeE
LSAGLLFGFGLSLSGMIDPARVTGFLDVMSGHWDPSLLFVLGGAVLIAMAGVALQRKMASPLLDGRFHLPEKTQIDRRLLIGSAIFGIGWGLAGLCPGPAVSAISTGLAPVAFFVIMMVLGMYAHDRFIARGAK